MSKMKEEKPYIAVSNEFMEEFNKLGYHLKKAKSMKSSFDTIRAFAHIEAALKHYNNIWALLQKGQRVKLKLKEEARE